MRTTYYLMPLFIIHPGGGFTTGYMLGYKIMSCLITWPQPSDIIVDSAHVTGT